jgi:hypothetical protein
LVTVSRDDLYVQVWTQPMTRVAADYGVTGTALKKTCDRHHVPTPKRGYWAKLQHRKPVRQTPLPNLRHARLAEVRIGENPIHRRPPAVRAAKLRALERIARTDLEAHVSDARVLASATAAAADVGDHAALKPTRKAISKARPDKQGLVSVKGRGIVPLQIAATSMNRALRILAGCSISPRRRAIEPRAKTRG